MLGRAAASLDVLSEGRVEFGLAAGAFLGCDDGLPARPISLQFERLPPAAENVVSPVRVRVSPSEKALLAAVSHRSERVAR
jgi:hypothetical protein